LFRRTGAAGSDVGPQPGGVDGDGDRRRQFRGDLLEQNPAIALVPEKGKEEAK